MRQCDSKRHVETTPKRICIYIGSIIGPEEYNAIFKEIKEQRNEEISFKAFSFDNQRPGIPV